MSYGLVRLPLWAVGLCAGLFWSLGMLVVPATREPGGPIVPALLILAVGGAVFGTFIAFTTGRQRRKLFHVDGRMLSGREREAVVRAVLRGEPLADDPLRPVADRYADRLRDAPRRRWLIAVMGVALMGGAVWLAVDSSPAWWVAVVAWPVLCAVMLWVDNRQRAAVERYFAREEHDALAVNR